MLWWLSTLYRAYAVESFWLMTRQRLKRSANMKKYVKCDIYMMISLWLGSGENFTYLWNSCLTLSMYRSWKSSILSPSFENKASPKTRRSSLRMPSNIKIHISETTWRVLTHLWMLSGQWPNETSGANWRRKRSAYLRYGIGKLNIPRMKGTPILTYLLIDCQKFSTARGSCLNNCRIHAHCEVLVSNDSIWHWKLSISNLAYEESNEGIAHERDINQSTQLVVSYLIFVEGVNRHYTGTLIHSYLKESSPVCPISSR